METLEFILHGVDAPSGTYLAWESAQCPPAFAVLERSRLVEVTQALARALPDYIDDDGAATPSESFDDSPHSRFRRGAPALASTTGPWRPGSAARTPTGSCVWPEARFCHLRPSSGS